MLKPFDFLIHGEIMATLTRSIVKGITHRAATVLMTFLMVLIATGDLGISSLFIVIDTIIMTSWYIGHERLWNRVDWGREGNYRIGNTTHYTDPDTYITYRVRIDEEAKQ